MVRKKLPDIRLLRDPLPAIAQQMVHLDSWQPVSRHPVARREVSVAAAADQDVEAITGQLLGALFPEEARLVQEVDVLGRWSVAELHPAAVARLGALPGQENLLLRHRGANRAYCT